MRVKNIQIDNVYEKNMTNPIQVCTKIREIRKSHNMNQQAFAEILGITSGHVSHLEKGTRGITVELVMAIYEKFGVTPNELLGVEKDKVDLVEIRKQIEAISEQLDRIESNV